MNCLTMFGVVSAAIVPFNTLPTVDYDGPKSSLVHCCIFFQLPKKTQSLLPSVLQ